MSAEAKPTSSLDLGNSTSSPSPEVPSRARQGLTLVLLGTALGPALANAASFLSVFVLGAQGEQLDADQLERRVFAVPALIFTATAIAIAAGVIQFTQRLVPLPPWLRVSLRVAVVAWVASQVVVLVAERLGPPPLPLLVTKDVLQTLIALLGLHAAASLFRRLGRTRAAAFATAVAWASPCVWLPPWGWLNLSGGAAVGLQLTLAISRMFVWGSIVALVWQLRRSSQPGWHLAAAEHQDF